MLVELDPWSKQVLKEKIAVVIKQAMQSHSLFFCSVDFGAELRHDARDRARLQDSSLNLGRPDQQPWRLQWPSSKRKELFEGDVLYYHASSLMLKVSLSPTNTMTGGSGKMNSPAIST